MSFRLEHQFTGAYADKADFGEQLGEMCLGFARAAFGHHEVSKNVEGQVKTTAEKANIFAIVAFILTIPISGLLTLAGAISLAASRTHAQNYSEYAQNVLEHKAQ